jgi:hypothetical protein
MLFYRWMESMPESTLFCILSVSWVSTQVDKCGAPKLKGARLFSLAELKRATNGFHKSHEIGAGGYGKVLTSMNASSCFVIFLEGQVCLFYTPAGIQGCAVVRRGGCYKEGPGKILSRGS